jgi:hypothetical protein
MPPNPAKRPLFDLPAIRRQVGAKVFDRGDAYFQDDAVQLLSFSGRTIKARVAGTEHYRVALELNDRRPVQRLAGDCSCPARIDFGLCKHMVATAFAANAAEEVGAWPTAEETPSAMIEGWLNAMPKDKLVKLVLDLAEGDEDMERKLTLKAAAAPGGSGLASAATAIGRALRQAAVIHGGYIAYGAMGAWAEGMQDVLGAIEAIIAPGCSSQVRPLLEAARDHAGSAMDNGDDSDGELTPVFERIDALILKMRLADPPEPLGLAEELFGELMDDDGYGHVPLEDYWPLLGDAGCRELERLARQLWPNVLPKRRGGGFIDEYFPSRHRLFQLLDRLAERKGDLDARIALRREDARSAYDIVRLVEFLISEGRAADAMGAAEEGHFEFADKPDDRLTGLLAGLYRKNGSSGQAEKVLWNNFVGRPDMRSFELLVGSSAVDARNSLEERAITHIADLRQKHSRSGTALRGAGLGDLTGLLLAIFSNTRRFDEAWSLADKAGLKPGQLRPLAEASIASHADKAIPVLRALAETAISQGVGGRYEEPLRFIDLVLKHARGAAAAAEAKLWLRSLSRDHARKRNFIAGLAGRLHS